MIVEERKWQPTNPGLCRKVARSRSRTVSVRATAFGQKVSYSLVSPPRRGSGSGPWRAV